jgi:anthranilate phosphoribosyltransferase
MSCYSPDTFKQVLSTLVKSPENFSPADLKLALDYIFTPDAVVPAQIGCLLTALYIYRIERNPACLAAAADAMRQRSLGIAVEGSKDDFVVDIVGTGGDGYNTYNVSTTAGIVAAGAGARVVKVSDCRDICFLNYKETHCELLAR